MLNRLRALLQSLRGTKPASNAAKSPRTQSVSADVPKSGPVILESNTPRPFQPALGNSDTLDAVEKYLDEHLDGDGFVFHEIVSDLIHLDVHAVPPGPRSDAWTLLTSGMSDLPMPKAEKFKVPAFAELMLRMPASWMPKSPRGEVVKPGMTDDLHWPINTLKRLARMPHDCDSALGFGHTICFTDPPAPLRPGVPFVGAMLLPPVHLGESAFEIHTKDGRDVQVYSVHLLLADEMEFKLKHGTDAMLDLFDKVSHSDIVNPKRRSVLDQ